MGQQPHSCHPHPQNGELQYPSLCDLDGLSRRKKDMYQLQQEASFFIAQTHWCAHLSSKMHHCVDLVLIQQKTDEICALDVAFDKLHMRQARQLTAVHHICHYHGHCLDLLECWSGNEDSSHLEVGTVFDCVKIVD